jgi:hypothetical protein
MSGVIRAATVAGSLMLAGCSIHPLPEDVTGVDTLDIVKQIRCEARATLRTIVIDWLAERGAALGDPLLQRLAAQYQSNPASINTFNYTLFKGQYAEYRSVVKLFYDAGIAYTFDLTGTETNNLDAQASFLKVFSDHRTTLGLTGNFDRTRSNQRTFTVTDTFGKLLTKVPEKYCDGKIVAANYVYPVVGRIGIDRTIKSFIDLTLFGSLSGPKDAAAAPPTMTDNLVFTTTLNLGINPMAVFTPLTGALQLTNASLMAEGDRSDRHQVTVGLAIGKEGKTELDPLRSYLFSTSRVAPVGRSATVAGGFVIGGRVIGGGTSTETLAVIAIDQIKSQEIKIVPTPLCGGRSVMSVTTAILFNSTCF